MVQVVTSGRTDIEALISDSGIIGSKRLKHTPFLVFVVDGDTVRVEIVDKPLDLIKYPPETPLMVQWMGQWHSDFFHMTVGDVRSAIIQKQL